MSGILSPGVCVSPSRAPRASAGRRGSGPPWRAGVQGSKAVTLREVCVSGWVSEGVARRSPGFSGTITSFREQAQDQAWAVGQVSCKVALRATFPWNVLPGTLELRLDAEAWDRAKCSSQPAGASDLVNGRRAQDRLAEVVLSAERVSSEDVLRKSPFKGVRGK